MPTLVNRILTGGNNHITGNNHFNTVITTANALQNTGVTAVALTTSFIAMPTSFVGAGETLTAIGLEVGAVGVLTGVTLTIRLRNTTDGVNTDYTYDATLLTTGGRGWNFFSLGAGQVLTAGKSWQIQLLASVTSRVSLYRLGTTIGDWNRIFVTDTTATYAAGDTLYLGGRILTSGSIDTTSFEVNNSISLFSLFINNGASLSWTSNSLTMTLSGNLFIYPGSSFTIGTALSPVSGLIQFSNGTTFGLNAFSVFGPCTFNIYGSDVSSNYNIDLASTANSGQANAVLTSAPDWVNGQLVVYTSSRTAASSEIRTVSSVSSNTVTSTTNFTNAHDVTTRGTYSPVPDVAKACLMNRGFVVANTALSTTGSWFGSIYGAVTCNWDTVFFRDQGANAGASGTVPSKYGWAVDITSGGSFAVDNCSFYPSNQVNSCAIWSENSNTRLGTNCSITNCLMVSRTASNGAFLFVKGDTGTTTTISGCIAICTVSNTGYTITIRNDNSANVVISNCFSYGFPVFINRADTALNGVGAVTVNNCFSIGTGFYLVTTLYSTGLFILGSTTISNCTAINRITGASAAIFFSGVTSVIHTISSCKFIGFNRYFYTTASLQEQTIFDNCVFEDDTVVSQNAILVGVSARPNTTFKSCYFSTTFANQSIMALSWSNLPLYSGGNFYFRSCSFNGDGSLFIASTSLKYFAGFAATLESCLFRSGTTLNRNYIKMGTATVSTDTFSGTGRSIALTPYSVNDTNYPFRYQFLLPIGTTSFTVNFKTKSYGLNGTVKAYVENVFGVVTQSVITVSSGWDSQSLSVTVGSSYTELLNLTIELTGNSGYLIVDDIAVGDSNGIVGESGKYAFLNTLSETSYPFCS